MGGVRSACGKRKTECVRIAECGVRKFVSGATFGVAGALAPVRLSLCHFLLRFIEKENGRGTKKALAFYIRKTENGICEKFAFL